MSTVAQEVLGVSARPSYRWVQLVIGIVCMAMIANLQYGWTLFVSPIDAKYHWGRAALQIAFSVFVLVGAGGLMATAQLAPIAKDFAIAEIPVSLVGTTLPALTFALAIDRILNGITRPFFGWVSDNIGRELTML